MSLVPHIQSFNHVGADTGVRLVEVTPAMSHLLPQLVGKDDVHDFGTQSVDQLRRYRIGGDLFAKTVFAITDAAAQTIFAAIYVHKTPKPINSIGDVPGNVGHILAQNSLAPIHGSPTAFVFYSITNIRGDNGKPLKNGAGAMLINALLTEADLPPITLSTLSPLRTLAKSIAFTDGEVLSDNERLALAYAHLMQRANPVQKFHMGNGAVIGDIKLRATMNPMAPDATQGLNVMINYHYPNDAMVRERNKAVLADSTQNPARLRDLFSSHVLARVDAVADEVAAMSARLVVRPKPAPDRPAALTA